MSNDVVVHTRPVVHTFVLDVEGCPSLRAHFVLAISWLCQNLVKYLLKRAFDDWRIIRNVVSLDVVFTDWCKLAMEGASW